MEIEGAVVASMATFPPRYAQLRPVAASLAHQVDRLFVYVNGALDGFPDLSDLSNVIVLDARRHRGDLSANGKIYPLRYVRDSYVFTVDDDFIYPPDYVAVYLRLLRAFDGACCVTTHGSIFPAQVRWYYERCKTFSATHKLEHVQLASLAGSGTFAFHQSALPFDPDDLLGEVMVDLRLSLAARDRDLPIWCVRRPEGWLRSLSHDGLWQTFRREITPHTIEARRHDWSFERYRRIARGALERGGGVPLDPELRHGLETGVPPAPWRRSRVSYGRRGEYLELLEDLDGAAG